MGALSWGLDMANFENIPVQLQGFEMENVSMLWSVFMGEVLNLIKVPWHVRLGSACSTTLSIQLHRLTSSPLPGRAGRVS